MAKRLIRDYIFQPDTANEGYIAIKGNYKENEILLVTNVTDNIIIYNFAQPGRGGSCLYSTASDVTVLTLEADTSSMSAGDSIQIFVDEEYTQVDFNEALIDPVNKIRISSPQNLIDTDFEYGLQPSKWETLELVNNIPAFYPTQSDYSIPDVVSVASLAGSNLITVTTESPHGIPIGTPLEVRGLDSQTAEGKYLVTTVPSDKTFTYKARTNQQSTKTISGPYTVIIPGEFYSSSDVKYSPELGIISDEQSPSQITVQTDYVHGLQEQTSVYLTNTFAARLAELTQNASATAPDGRPYVDHVDTVTTSVTGDSTQNETKDKRGITYLKFDASSVDISTNTIAWPGNNFGPGEALLYVPPAGDTEIGGLQRFQIYYVKEATSSGIKLCETTNGDYWNNPVIDLTSTGTYNYGRAELLVVYEIKRIYRGSTETAAPGGGGQPCGSFPWYCPWRPTWAECIGYC